MKTIAVLIDFSERSEHAARYAFHLAQKVEANILLFNAFLTPSDIPMVAAEVAWPLDYEENMLETEKALQTFAKNLHHWAGQRNLPGDYMPDIDCECQQGPLTVAINVIENNKEIFLLVMGTHGADGLTTLMLGNTCRQLIDSTKLPLLLVPEHARFKAPERFAFATELQFADMVYLNALARLAACFSAEIMLTYVGDGIISDQEDMDMFMKRVANKVDYDNITFRTFPGKTPKKGLQWLLDNHKPDMLVMMHRDRGFFASIFQGSNTQKIVAHTPVPVLVFTYSAKPVFGF